MKRLIALLLILVITITATSMTVTATETDGSADEPFVVVDGILDDTYYENRVINDDWWYCFDEKNAFEPVDYEFLYNTLRFTWDDDFVYFYYTCTSKGDPLYKPAEGETYVKGVTPAETISLYIDTAPSVPYGASCQSDNTKTCKHFNCNCNDGEGKYNRVQARVNPAFDNWYNYYRSDEGVFLTFEKFCALRCDPDSSGYGEDYVADPEGMYLKENGACKAVCFIDYETNTYGCELSYPRGENEEYFLCNFVTSTLGYDWGGDIGPELPYNESACLHHWMVEEGAGMFEIYYDEYPAPVDPSDDPAVAEVMDSILALPMLKDVTLEETTPLVTAIEAKMAELTSQQIGTIPDDVIAKLEGVTARLSALQLAGEIGDANQDGVINATDALEILKSVVGKVTFDQEATVLADVNDDDSVNATDALDILKFVVGKLTIFPAAENLLK